MVLSKKREWILLADQAHARIYTRNYVDSAMQQLLVLEHPAARQHQRQQGTDRPGRGQSTGSHGRHAYEDHARFPEQESAAFLRGVAQQINTAIRQEEMDQIILVALPRTMELIKSELTEQARDKVAAEYAKNLIGMPEDKMINKLIKLDRLPLA